MPLTKYSLGTHLDDGQLRLLYLRKAWRDVQVIDTLTLSFPSAPEAEGAFSQEVQKFLLRNGVRPFDAVTFGVPRADILFRHFATPPVQEKDLDDLVGFESERHLPGSREEFAVGYRSLGKTDDGGRRLILAAVKKEVLERYAAALRQANLTPGSVRPATLGSIAAFRFVHPEPETALLVTLGESSVSADCFSGDQVAESRYYRLPVSGEDGAALEAERLGAWLSDPLFVEKLPGGVLPTVWLQGTPVSESFRAGLREALGVSVEIFRPPVQSMGEGGADAGFGPAFGLALLGLDGSNRGLELSEERKEGFEEGPKYGATAALAALLVLVVLGTLGLRGLQHHRHLSGIEEEIAAMKEEKAAVEQLSLAVRTKRSRLEFITANLNKVRQADLLREMTLLIPDDTYLSDYTFRDGRIEISGLSPSASRLIPLLEASPLFRNVHFSSAIVSQGKESERFKIRLNLEEEGG
jgi:Tfp pilus assembly protein PilN